jgi:cephalosporin-C deacetylase-like acetyl esterase
MIQRTDVEFEVDGGVKLRGWLFVPPGAGRRPAITMAHGYAGVKEQGIEPFAKAFAEAGFVVLLHDHRGFGASEGLPRHDIDPWRQIADWRRAISFLETLDAVDPKRIGLWGTSYAGGHAIVLGATDRRLKCVVAQVPTISGYEQGLRRIPPENVAAIEEMFADDDRAQLRGEPPRRQAIVSDDMRIAASYRARDAIDFYLQPVPPGAWENNVTVRSTRAARMYEPGQWIARVSPTPLLMVVAMRDTITLTDLELAAYERALQPKRLVTIEGGHFDPYLSQIRVSSGAAVEWFKQHLG